MTTNPTGTLSIPLAPSGAGVYSTRKLSVNVATNNPTGYTMTMSAGASGNALTNPVATTNNTLSTTSGSVNSPSSIGLNNWGFAVPKTQANSMGLLPNNTSGFNNTYSEYTSVATLTDTYAGMPLVASPLTLKVTTAMSNNDNTDLYFGARVDTTKPAGSYYGTVVFSVVANYVPCPYPPYPMIGPDDPACIPPQYLQEVTADTCFANTRVMAIDARDNHTYWIQQLDAGAGNNWSNGSRYMCFMETNLAYAGEGSNTYNDTKSVAYWDRSSSYFGGSSANAISLLILLTLVVVKT